MGAAYAWLQRRSLSVPVSEAAPEVPIRDAATIILLRRSPESCRVLMGMRGAQAAFMPSKYVFPGGAVDAADANAVLATPLPEPHRGRLLSARNAQGPAPDTVAAAALRELAEETGQLIGKPAGAACNWPGYAETGLTPDPSALNFIFRAVTPPGRPRRFDAYFFAIDALNLSTDPDDFSKACDELSHLHWVPLPEVRALNLPFITEVVLAEVAELAASVPYDASLPVPDTVPYFNNYGSAPRFMQIA